MASSTSVGSQGGVSSFSAWFQEAEKTAKSGGDPLRAGKANASNGSSAYDVLPSWMKSWTQSDVRENVDLEAGGLLSAPTIAGAEVADDYTLSRTERFKWFVALLSLGIFFFLLALMLLGTVIVVPGKFAFSFTLGSLSFMSAFILLQGFKQWASEVFRKERLPFTIAYFGSIVGTLVATLYLHSYIFIVLFSCLQISSLGWYFATYVPGGQYGMKMISTVVKTACMTCVKGCRLCVGV